MDLLDSVRDAVYEAIDELNELRDEEKRLEKDEDIALVGDDGCLSSLDVVNLIATIEERIEESMGVSIFILSGDPLPEDPNPLRNLGNLISYLVECIGSKQGSG